MMTNMNRRVDPESLKDAPAWSVADAKARLSDLLARARAGQPQRITRYGKEDVVVISVADWEQRDDKALDKDWADRPGGLLELFAPLIGSGVTIERMKGDFRPIFPEEE